MMELTKEEQIQAIYDLKVGYTLGHADIAMLKAMARQLLASMEQEPVAYFFKHPEGKLFWSLTDKSNAAHPDVFPVYAAPKLPQPAVVSDVTRKDFEAWARAAGFNEDWYFFTNVHPNHYDDDHINDMWAAWNACRAAMRQGSEPVHDVDNTNRQFESLGCAEDTSRRFKCTGLIVTSDERKMEIPHCSKHPQTELQVHPFKQLMSYPPRPVMYCPECEPWIDDRIKLDKQIRRARETK